MNAMETLKERPASATSLTTLLNAPEPTPKTYRVEEVFGFPSQMTLPGFAPGHPLVPLPNPHFVWSPGLAKDFIEWVNDPQPDPLWLTGPTGCGKTEVLKQIFACLHIPTVIVSAKKSTEPDDILGRIQLVDGNTIFTPGPLLWAYAKGYAIVFDEIDGYNPEVLMACHRLLERAPVTLDDGTVVVPARRGFMAATANTRGDGQGGDLYTGTSVFNLATLNRFEKWEMGYPPPEVEAAILARTLPQLDAGVVQAMVKVAGDVRVAFESGHCPGPLSLRDLIRWGRKLTLGSQRRDVPPLYHAFDKAFGNGVERPVRAMLHKLVQTHFSVPAPEMPTP